MVTTWPFLKNSLYGKRGEIRQSAPDKVRASVAVHGLDARRADAVDNETASCGRDVDFAVAGVNAVGLVVGGTASSARIHHPLVVVVGKGKTENLVILGIQQR